MPRMFELVEVVVIGKRGFQIAYPVITYCLTDVGIDDASRGTLDAVTLSVTDGHIAGVTSLAVEEVA